MVLLDRKGHQVYQVIEEIPNLQTLLYKGIGQKTKIAEVRFMKYKLVNGNWSLVEKDALATMQEVLPLTSTAFIVDIPRTKESIHRYVRKGLGDGRFATVAIGGSGVFWKAFLTYIFPWMLDIAKVYCAIKIAQAFYEEKRGGRDGGTGMQAVVQYGKWYLVFWCIPWLTELIDGIGGTMFNELRSNKIDLKPTMVEPYRR
ncbi:hypothetical protein PQE72_gp015 [Bacillus phage vB_BanS_Skywalker]|uniref:Uncharacterized protein n=1 Tax=Bacillus phage vB_BanS_Skywalker TaxID=2894789 RepID=A0AAE8YUS5_9CAUD|nr:hypothetical protein PQE72_gp015 [Bacillus phage vB_BanS_Skywalker]UGO51193.1 hypothetical protein SKYWALKER_15 [Bacillus phage vB_BanS_Skywalker]